MTKAQLKKKYRELGVEYIGSECIATTPRKTTLKKLVEFQEEKIKQLEDDKNRLRAELEVTIGRNLTDWFKQGMLLDRIKEHIDTLKV